MRKKGHKRLNPQNKEYDVFYIGKNFLSQLINDYHVSMNLHHKNLLSLMINDHSLQTLTDIP